jgi:hypothetical protein
MDKKPTRAAQMAEHYGDILEKLNPTPKKPRVIKAIDTQTQEQKDKLRVAREKLATFRDLLG